MKVILLERIQHLGSLGEEVVVKNGYGRNCLLPQGKAVLATRANIAYFQEKRAEFEAAAAERLGEDQKRADKLASLTLTIQAKVAEEGKLYGSVGPAEIVAAVKEAGGEATKQEVTLPNGPLREIGEYDVDFSLHHGDIVTQVKVNIVPEE